MESLSVMLGLTLMLITPILVVVYVAFVIAVPICRSIDRMGDSRSGRAPSKRHLRLVGHDHKPR